MEPIIGIDLGTTNSEVAFIFDGVSEVIKENDNGIVPSCVGLNNEGKIIVGAEARNQALVAPDRTVLSVKRLMGSDKKLILQGKAYLPQEISAFILKALKARAETAINQSISKAVITVPAYFTDAQRQATREAGEIAGLEVVRIINEPTAASLAYESASPETKTILVYDLGGGTFDVSIVKIEQGVVEVLASTGDNMLGGDDFDNKIIGRLIDHVMDKDNIDLSKDQKAMARLKHAAENAKKELSSNPYFTIEEDHIGKKLFKDIHLTYELSRIEFESMIEEDFLRTMDSVNNALHDAELLPANIDKIILVGGSTRIPQISQMLEKKFNMQPHSEIDPDLCVALGAGIQAGREMGDESSTILLDITPYTFGTSAIGEIDGVPSPHMFVPMIRKNTKLPTSTSDAFYTVVDNQEAVDIKVFQGEKKDARDNIKIGNYYFKLSGYPAGSVIIMNFDLDINGILKIEAVEKETGKKINGVIENAFTGYSNEEMAKARQMIDDMMSLPEKPEEVKDLKLPSAIEEIIKDAEEKLEKASEEDKEEIVDLIDEVKSSVKGGNMADANKAVKELEEILFYIG